MPEEGPGPAARRLRLPGRTLETSAHVQSDRKHLRDRTTKDEPLEGVPLEQDRLAMVFKLVEGGQKTWRRLDGHNQLPKIIRSVTFGAGYSRRPAWRRRGRVRRFRHRLDRASQHNSPRHRPEPLRPVWQVRDAGRDPTADRRRRSRLAADHGSRSAAQRLNTEIWIAILPDCCCLIRINAGPSVFSAVYVGRGS